MLSSASETPSCFDFTSSNLYRVQATTANINNVLNAISGSTRNKPVRRISNNEVSDTIWTVEFRTPIVTAAPTTTTTSTTTTSTTSTTTTTTAAPVAYTIDSFATGTSILACSTGSPSVTIYALPGYTTPIVTMIFYSDVTLTTPYVGGAGWRKFTYNGIIFYAGEIDINGQLTNYVTCP